MQRHRPEDGRKDWNDMLKGQGLKNALQVGLERLKAPEPVKPPSPAPKDTYEPPTP
jgi:hypothetical protein